MNPKKIIFTVAFILFSWSICKAQVCDKLSVPFGDYESAVSLIQKSSFEVSDTCDTSKSSWIVAAEYNSCDGIKGFFIVSTRRNKYIHQNIPIVVWKGFKKANSFGRYYNVNIKGRYPLKLK